MKSGRYWVYEDRPTNKAWVHLSECSFYLDGHGVHSIEGLRKPDNKWHGPFSSRQSAFSAANRTRNARFLHRLSGLSRLRSESSRSV